MKNLNTALLLVLIVVVGANFYFDKQQKSEIEKLKNEVVELQQATSPFNQTPQQLVQPKEDALGETTTISFDKKEHDFGTIKTSAVYSTTFYITNTGKEDLLISKAVGSCGCTVPEWDEKPIKKGEKTAVKVNFDTKGKEGEQLKTVTITANTVPSETVFTIKAKVIL